MSKKAFSMVVIIVLLGLVLSACTRSASEPPAVTATSPGDFPFPVEDGEGQPAAGSTQTVEAKEPLEMTPQAGGGVIETPVEGDQAGGGVPAQGEQTDEVEEPAQQEEQEAEEASNGEAVALPTVTRPATYTLKRGEWPYCIARRFDLPVGTLLSMNGLGNESKPGAGTVLTIPQTGSWNTGSRTLKSHPTTHVVAAGESVNSIACAYGDVDPSGIIALNGLEEPYSLTTGQSLKIP